MKLPRALHSWSVTPRQAVVIQRRFADRIIQKGHARRLRLLAGVDLAFLRDEGKCIAGVVVWDVQAGEVVEQHVIRRPVRFPYIPGLLSFREAPAILAVLRKLRCEPDVFLFDGQGYAHPRRFGLACHVGLLIDRPSVGCAKSLLVGTCKTPGTARGSMTRIEHHGECVGMALRTRDNVKPVYISVGHRLSLETAVEVALAGCTGFRLPEPTRLADRLVARERQRGLHHP
ncbi:MAG: deoxyribonuclease V [Phycisphaerae bacterium]